MAIWRVKFSSRFCTHWDKNKGKHLCIYNVRERGCFSQRRQTSVFASTLTPVEQLSNCTSKDQLLPILLLLRRLLHTSHSTTQPLRLFFLSATQAFLPVSLSATQTFLNVSHSGFSSSQPLSHSDISSCQPLPLNHSGCCSVSHSATQAFSVSATQPLRILSG